MFHQSPQEHVQSWGEHARAHTHSGAQAHKGFARQYITDWLIRNPSETHFLPSSCIQIQPALFGVTWRSPQFPLPLRRHLTSFKGSEEQPHTRGAGPGGRLQLSAAGRGGGGCWVTAVPARVGGDRTLALDAADEQQDRHRRPSRT